MSNEVEQIVQQTEALLRLRNEETLQETTPQRLHECLGEVVMVHINDNWVKTKKRQTAGRRAFYFSAEYLVGRLVYSNLFNLGILSEVKKAFAEKLLMEERVRVSDKDKKAVRDVMKETFRATTSAEDEDAIMKNFQRYAQNTVYEIERLEVNYKQYPYPGKRGMLCLQVCRQYMNIYTTYSVFAL